MNVSGRRVVTGEERKETIESGTGADRVILDRGYLGWSNEQLKVIKFFRPRWRRLAVGQLDAHATHGRVREGL